MLYISNISKMKIETKMAKNIIRIKKMNFQKQSLKYEPLSEEHKYIIHMAGYRKQELQERINNEDISRSTGRVTSPQYI